MSSCKLTKKNKKEQSGGFLFFGGTKKRKRQEFKTSMRNFCKVTRDGNNIPKGQKVTRRLINDVCSNFYEIEDDFIHVLEFNTGREENKNTKKIHNLRKGNKPFAKNSMNMNFY